MEDSILEPDKGSFRDPSNRVYKIDRALFGHRRILRGINESVLKNFNNISFEGFYQNFVAQGKVIPTVVLDRSDADADEILNRGWVGVLEHEEVPFISYPYEWTFSMLRDAALLQLELLESCLENGWTMKDCTPFNVQWIGARPVFIDIPSFEPWQNGEPWVGYRQFCSMYLTPLLMRTHLGIDHLPLMRSCIDGIPPMEAVKFFPGLSKFRRGVLSHIFLPAKVEARVQRKERDNVQISKRRVPRQSKAMVIGLVQGLARLVSSFKPEIRHTDWSRYDKTHSYEEADFEAKKAFVLKHVSACRRDHVWDLGCNTGTFSRLAADHCNLVLALDGDHDSVEQLYLSQRRAPDGNILPLVMNLANMSPGQGWAGAERAAFDQRKKPDLVLCLALIHHLRISANIPCEMFLRWLHSLRADVIIEFVDREDEMVAKLLTNKKEQYEDYNIDQFCRDAGRYFDAADRRRLKGGKREIFFLKPKD